MTSQADWRVFLPGLNRRHFLAQAVAGMGLAWRGRDPGRGRPARLIVVFFPNGVWPAAWTPEGEGREFAWSKTLAPLAPWKEDVLVLSGLRNANSASGDGHYAKSAPILTGAAIRRTGGINLWNAVSMDQVAAAEIGRTTAVPSLELGTEPVRAVEDMGYTTVYGGHIAWRTPSQPLPKETRPKAVFDRLFRAESLRQPGAGRVLDLVRDEARAFSRRMPGADRAKLAEYLDAVHAMEARIAALAGTEASRDGLNESPGDPRDFPAHLRALLDLGVLAFRSDTTRVITLMTGNAVSGRDFSFLEGVRGGHHDLSHHENDPEKQRQYQRINQWHVEELARLLSSLAAIREGEERLLDRTMVLFLGSLRDGNAHDPNDLPVILAGGRSLGVPLGQHLRMSEPTPLCNLHLAILNRLGITHPSFGDSTRALF